jgi:excisionase family DNA binding protein
MGKDVLTPGEVARICNVSNPTVIKWIDSDMLKGFRIPGSKARRVTKKDLLEFLVKHGMPLEKLNGIRTKIFVIEDDVNFCKMLKREFDLDGSLDVLIVQNAFSAGAMLEEFKPDVILLDICLEGIDGRDVCKFIRQNTGLKQARIIAMSGAYSSDAVMGQDGVGFDGFLRKPFKFIELKEMITKLQGNEAEFLSLDKNQGA